VNKNQFSAELFCEGIGVLESLFGAVGKVDGDEDFFEANNGGSRGGFLSFSIPIRMNSRC
jgi:hypothetical protein